MAEKYNASNIALEQILNYIKSGEIAIPEIQRPFCVETQTSEGSHRLTLHRLSNRVSHYLAKS